MEFDLKISRTFRGGDVPALIRSLTRLPFELAVTHAHGDHMYHSNSFGKFYMSKKEEAILPDFIAMMMPESKTTVEDIIDIRDGELIDLGGGVVIEAIELCGHTPGSICFLDRFHNIYFTGDAVGCGRGVWMQVPGALDLSIYKKNLESFLERISEQGLEGMWFLSGHRNQEWGLPEDEAYNPISKELIADMAALCQLIIDDDADVEVSPFALTEEKAFCASYGTATIHFLESNKEYS